MLDDNRGSGSSEVRAGTEHRERADSYTLIVRLGSGIELEYDLDPLWFPGHMTPTAP